jgi:phosphate transport system substrate-binding protein
LRKLITATASIALLTSVAFAGPAHAAESISGEGSSFANGRITACAASYTGGEVTYAATGSGNGRTAFIKGTRDFAGSDSVFKTTDVVPNKYVYVPVTGGPIAFAYNVGGLNNLKLTPELIAAIFSGKVTKWNDARIAKLNKGAQLPNKVITVGYRSGSSGTSENLTDFLVQSKKANGWSKNGTFESAAPSLPAVKFTAANSQEMATKIDQNGYSIGYVDLFEVIDADLQFASLSNFYSVTTPAKTTTVGGKTVKTPAKTSIRTQYVQPTAAASGLFLNSQTAVMAVDGSIKIDFTKRVKNAYPASLFTYIIAPTANGTTKGSAIRGFVDFVVNKCKATPGYATFPTSFKTSVNKLIAKIN